MLIWYVGAGDGNGNPYGIAASFVSTFDLWEVFIIDARVQLSFSVFLLFIRLYCAQYQMEVRVHMGAHTHRNLRRCDGRVS